MSDLQSLEKRFDKLESKVENISTQATRTDAQYSYLVQSIAELKGQINNLASIPNKRWETVIAVVITAIITLAIGKFLGK